MEVVNALGRRKRAVASVFVSEGTGQITASPLDSGRRGIQNPKMIDINSYK